ncbi:Aste57867_21435 [Aphanomyces stellatus]|uniref:Aste57867_21435 protein n=1 Tax=Aphanomyces stellatus TaxID=120398 RepID=A0A485LHJ4_9STRA|nr:hypothetical protein As57867_021366 [Aphanomyces stellatus]VFT98106.1 Aste57867_21435 [Aphanomyces stellatus]
MGALLSFFDGSGDVDASTCRVMSPQEITSCYAKLQSSLSTKPHKRIKTSATAAQIQQLLRCQQHPLFTPLADLGRPVVPFGRLSRANSFDSTVGVDPSAEEIAVKDLNGRVDHDTDALFRAIQAFQATCKSNDEFCHGLAQYRRAVKLWTHYQDACGYHVDAIPDLLRAKAGVAAAKFAYRHATLDARLAQLATAKALEDGTPFYARTLEHHKTLLQRQQEWDATLLCCDNPTTASGFVDRSVVETIFNLVALAPFFDQNLMLEAVQVAETFQVHPKQFWWTVLHCCVRTNQCEILEWILPDTAVPIAKKEIVEALVDAKQYDVAKHIAEMEGRLVEKTKLLELVQRAQTNQGQPDGEPAPVAARPMRKTSVAAARKPSMMGSI